MRHCCRFCLTEKEKFLTVFCEDDPSVTLRSKGIHLQHCEFMQVNPTLNHVYGVRRSCLLDELKFFSVSENFSVHIMQYIGRSCPIRDETSIRIFEVRLHFTQRTTSSDRLIQLWLQRE